MSSERQLDIETVKLQVLTETQRKYLEDIHGKGGIAVWQINSSFVYVKEYGPTETDKILYPDYAKFYRLLQYFPHQRDTVLMPKNTQEKLAFKNKEDALKDISLVIRDSYEHVKRLEEEDK